ncbi:MAG: cytochrome c [Rhodocyclaceae bacterium]|nr:cytochrome c [Rhodocyclaceae bacterium]
MIIARIAAQRLAGLVLAAMLGAATAAAPAAGPLPARRAALLNLLDQDCGSCHGLRRTGGLGPALTREALAGKSPATLRAVILDGRSGTAMPPWRGIVSEAEATFLVDVLVNEGTDAHKP